MKNSSRKGFGVQKVKVHIAEQPTHICHFIMSRVRFEIK